MLSELTQEYLKSILDYDQSTGEWRWRERVARCTKAGDIAGNINSNGYCRIFIAGKSRYAHRLVWLYVYGRWPSKDLDHINGVRKDNRFCNLREARRFENMANIPARVGKLKGTYKYRGKWRAQIKRDNRLYYLGSFATEKEAHEAYWAKAKALFGEFARAA